MFVCSLVGAPLTIAAGFDKITSESGVDLPADNLHQRPRADAWPVLPRACPQLLEQIECLLIVGINLEHTAKLLLGGRAVIQGLE